MNKDILNSIKNPYVKANLKAFVKDIKLTDTDIIIYYENEKYSKLNEPLFVDSLQEVIIQHTGANKNIKVELYNPDKEEIIEVAPPKDLTEDIINMFSGTLISK